ncbi:MAG: OmpH family outer membrane protein [Bacteroidia bacterium]|nr:OmpH family outer membrane protein [Bacteroidia bacterium]
MKSKRITLILLGIVIGIANVQAQDKIGFVDESYIISQMPEYKQVQAEMDAYEKKVKTELETKKAEYDTKVAAVKELAQQTPPPSEVILQARLREIQELEKQILEMQQSAQAEYSRVTDEKMKPVTEKLEKNT